MSRSVSDRLLAGETVVLDPALPAGQRVVTAEALAQALRAGGRVELAHALVSGSLALANTVIRGDVRLADCHFDSPLLAPGACFERSLRIERCALRGADFDSARFRAQVSLAGSRFTAPAGCPAESAARLCRFNDAQFDDVLDAQDTVFPRGLRPSFCRVRFGNSTVFQGARFFAGADFSGASVRGSLWLGHTVSSAELDLSRLAVSGDLTLAASRGGRHAALGLRLAEVGGVVDLSRARWRGAAQLDDLEARRGLSLVDSRFGAALGAPRLRAAWLDGRAMQVRGMLDLDSLRVGELWLPRARVWGGLRLAYAAIEGCVDLSGLRARGATALNLEGARIGQQASFDGGWYRGAVRAIGLQAGQQLSWVGARVTGEAEFSELEVQRGVYLNRSRWFADLNLNRAVLHGDLHGAGLVCTGVLGLHGATAGRLRLHATPAGVPAAQLIGGINATHGRFDYVGAMGVVFGVPGGADRPAAAAEFEHCEVRGVANFSDAVCHAPLSLYGADIGGEFIFQRVRLLAGKATNLHGASFREPAFFYHVEAVAGLDLSYARFEQTATFRMRCGGQAKFDFCQFRGNAEFSDLDAPAWDAGDALWQDTARHPVACVFEAASFVQSRFDGDARFEGVLFRGALDLRQSTLAALYLPSDDPGAPGGHLPPVVELSGCRYARLVMARPQALLEHADGRLRLQGGYARAAFAQMEEILRRGGQEAAANTVYLARRRHERLGKRGLRRLFDEAYRMLAHYGVQPSRLAWVSLAGMVAGTLFFVQPGAVMPKDKALAAAPYVVSTDEAVMLTLSQFLPVSLPIKEHLVPAARPVTLALPGGQHLALRPTAVATLLQLMGWIVVPIGIGAVSGLLMRKGR